MKQSSKIALGVAAGIAAIFCLRKKESVSGIGRIDGTKYIVRFIPKYYWEEDNGVWLIYPYIGLQNDRNHATRFNTRKEAEKCAQEVYDNYLSGYKGFEVMAIKDHDERRVQEAIDRVLSFENRTKYAMLDRMRMDCEYFLGNGHRHPQYLWMSMDPQGHIDVMRAIWDSFTEKPEWLTREKIDWYAEQMGVE